VKRDRVVQYGHRELWQCPGHMKPTFGRGEPEVDARVPAATDATNATDGGWAERAVIPGPNDGARDDPSPLEPADEALGPSQRDQKADPDFMKCFPRQERSLIDPGPPRLDPRGPHRPTVGECRTPLRARQPRPLFVQLVQLVQLVQVADRNNGIARTEQGRHRRSRAPPRAQASAGARVAPGLASVDGEEGKSRTDGRELGHAVEDQDISRGRRQRDRRRAGGSHDHPGPERRERADRDERFVADLFEWVSWRNEPRSSRARPVRVANQGDPRAGARQLSGAGDRQRRLPRASQRGSADGHDGHGRRRRKRPDDGTFEEGPQQAARM
jgi:hypothetical protein